MTLVVGIERRWTSGHRRCARLTSRSSEKLRTAAGKRPRRPARSRSSRGCRARGGSALVGNPPRCLSPGPRPALSRAVESPHRPVSYVRLVVQSRRGSPQGMPAICMVELFGNRLNCGSARSYGRLSSALWIGRRRPWVSPVARVATSAESMTRNETPNHARTTGSCTEAKSATVAA